MKLLIIGASQGTGALAVRAALDKWHSVTAFARHPDKLVLEHPELRRVTGDFHQASSVEAAVPGHDAVIVTASATRLRAFKENPRYFSQGTGYVIDAMKNAGVKRLVVLSALGVGESARLGGYDFKLLGTQPVEGPNYSATRATVAVTRAGEPITTLYPEARQFWVQQQTRKVAGIYNRYGTDLFIALGDDLGAGRWSLRAQIRPLISLLWLGPLLMALGGALALSDRRYRLARAAEPGLAATAGGEAH